MSFLEKPVERQSLSAVIEERLCRAIVSGEFPPGGKLAEPELAARLGVSRAPIREALIGLEFAGLVQSDERGRSIVPELTADDIREIYLLRLALEPLAARFATERMTPQILEQLSQNAEKTGTVRNHTELAALDTEFHDLIFHASGMSRLKQVWQCIRYQIELWLNQMQPRFSEGFETTRQQTMTSHQALTQAIGSGNGQYAEEMSCAHIQGWGKVLPFGPAGLSTTRADAI